MYKGCQCTTVTKIVNEEGGGGRECKCDCESTNAQHGLGLGRMHNNTARGTAHDRTARLITRSELRVANRPATLTFILHGAQARVAEKKLKWP